MAGRAHLSSAATGTKRCVYLSFCQAMCSTPLQHRCRIFFHSFSDAIGVCTRVWYLCLMFTLFDSRSSDMLFKPMRLRRRNMASCFSSFCVRHSLTTSSLPMYAPRVFVAECLIFTPSASSSAGIGISCFPPNHTHLCLAILTRFSARRPCRRLNASANACWSSDARFMSSMNAKIFTCGNFILCEYRTL